MSKRKNAEKDDNDAEENGSPEIHHITPPSAVADADDERDSGVVRVDKLQDFGISAADISKLKESGYHTVQSVLMTMKKKLMEIRGFSENKVEKLLSVASNVTFSGFTTGLEYEVEVKKLAKITTGSIAFDKLLGGGVECGGITEAFGEFGSGKSQCAHMLAVTCQLPLNKGGVEGKVLFIDTETTFTPSVIRANAERFGLDADAVLGNIIYAKAFNADHQTSLIKQAQVACIEHDVKLIIVDSVMALYRVNFQGRGELSDRQIHLGNFMHSLTCLADTFKIAVFITNQVTDNLNAMSAFAGNVKVPIGGNVLGHSSKTRIYLKKGKDSARKATIYDSPHLPKDTCDFQITTGGIRDID